MLSLRKIVAGGSWRSPLSKWHLSPFLSRPERFPLARALSTSVPPSVKALSESFLDGSSATYVDEMYHAWKADNSTVHKSWDAFFRNAEAGLAPGGAYMSPPTLGSVGHATSTPTSASLVYLTTFTSDSVINPSHSGPNPRGSTTKNN